MSFSTLFCDIGDDGIALVTLNRPDKLNALNSAVIGELDTLVGMVEHDDAIRALILTGAGPKAFVAGADIGELATLARQDGVETSARGSRVLRRLEQLHKPVVAAVNGFALGGGCELALACHVRLASPAARFGLPEVKLGLIPGFGGTVRLARLVGRGRATEIVLSAAMIGADEAFRIGLVNRVVPAESLIAEARALLGLMLANGPAAIGLALQAIDAGLDRPMDEALSHESTLFGAACDSDEMKEGTRAFLEKRPPQFRGR
jgi:enoyl-CoA hydratase